MTMREAWETEARNWIWWARDSRDSYWRFQSRRFFELLPAPCAMLDVGCGEGRLPRQLKERGFSVIGIDGSATLIEAAREADPTGDYRVADASALPFADGSMPLVTAYMSLHDTDDMPGAVAEIARVLAPGGRLCMTIVHPINSGGKFESREPDAPFVMRSNYFEHRRFADTMERDGHSMTFNSEHRPIEDYVSAIVAAGLLVDRLVEVLDTDAEPGSRWNRVPMFLQLRAVKPAGAGV
jgi:SAM-dependent methyltransferase